jgi:hypothetical protein
MTSERLGALARLFIEFACICFSIALWRHPTLFRPKVTEILFLVLTVICLLCGSSFLFGCAGEDTIHCSYTCVANGIAETATVCEDHPLREEICEEPSLMRRPEVEEKVRVYSSDDSRKTTVLSASKNSFRVGGPPNDRELGSAVISTDDGALLGIVQEYDDDSSECSYVAEKVED